MEKKKFEVWLPLWFAISMIIGIFFGYKMRDGNPGKKFFSIEKSNPLTEILTLINNKYVDSVNLVSLSDTAIEAMLSKLDPHSIYIPPADLDAVNEDIAGNFFGIGIEFNIFSDTLHVTNVLKDGPGNKAGLLTGDRIIAADGHILSGNKTSTDTIRKYLRGGLGSDVKLDVIRDGKKLNFTVKRDLIPVTSVDAAYMLDSVTGYIRLNKFSQQTHREFAIALEGLQKRNMKSLVFDLRGNGGGVLEEAVDIADEFLSGDKMITYTVGEHMPKKEFRCKKPGLFEEGKLVVLCDQGTASASEVIIGALRDWKRATLIGARTFGKGLVQDQFDLSNGGALRLTVARYYTPMGKSIQRSYANGAKAYYDEISDRFAMQIPGHDSIHKAQIASTDSGGIAPDMYIPFDTIPGTISARIYARGTLNSFGYRYYVSNRAMLDQYKNAAQFVTSFQLNPENWNSFTELSSNDSIDLSKISESEKTFLINRMKSAIARQLWRNEGYFEVVNIDDPAIKVALETIKK